MTTETSSGHNFWWLRGPSGDGKSSSESRKPGVQEPPAGAFRTNYDYLPEKDREGEGGGGAGDRTSTTHEFTPPSSRGGKKRRRTKWQKCALVAFFCGIVNILAAVICAFIMRPVVESQILNNMPLREGGPVFQGWKDPPVQPVLYMHVFNLTNKEDFLQGRAKPILQELGPYSYRQDMKKVKVELSADGSEVDYMQSRAYFFVPEISQGSEDDVIVVPNIPLFGAFKKLAPEPPLAKSIFLSLVQSYHDVAVDTQPFLTLTVKEFLWGYPSALLSMDRMQSNPNCVSGDDLESGFDDDSFGDDFFGNDSFGAAEDDDDDAYAEDYEDDEVDAEAPDAKYERGEKINCDIVKGNLAQFGLFMGRNNSVLDLRTIKTGTDDLHEKGIMVRWHGKTEVDYWRDTASVNNNTQLKCNKVEGRDPGTWPVNVNTDTKLTAFVGPLCRKLTFSYHKNVQVGQFETLQFVPDPRSFDSPDEVPGNACYCLTPGECLPSGLLNIEGCQEGSPIYLSWPHFLHGDPNLLKGVEGLTPNFGLHTFIFNIEPKYGISLSALAKLQMNVVIRRGDGYGFFDKISQDHIYYPFAWLSEGIPEPSKEMADGVEFVLGLPDMVKQLMGLGGMVFGLVLILPELVIWISRLCNRRKSQKECYIQSNNSVTSNNTEQAASSTVTTPTTTTTPS